MRVAGRALSAVLIACGAWSCSTVLGIEDLALYPGDAGGPSDTQTPSVESGIDGLDAATHGESTTGENMTEGGTTDTSSNSPDQTSSDSGDTGGAPNTPEGACDEYATTSCDVLQRCGPSPDFFFTSLDHCRTRERMTCLEEFSAPKTGATPALVHVCLQTEKYRACGRVFRTSLECRIKGQLSDGASCWSDWQCKGGRCAGVGLNCGKCTKLGQVGDACVDAYDCEDIDNVDCRTGKCGASASKGQACNPGYCAKGLWCQASTCTDAPLAKEGADCSALPCEGYKLTCDVNTQKCRPIVTYEPGELCGVLDNCHGAGYCIDTQNYVCPAISPDGQKCNGSFRCSLPAYCSNGTCVLPDPTRCGGPTDGGQDGP
jgi:hypothetical protein